VIVSVPFAYHAEYVEKGKRTFRSTQLRGELPVRIKTVEAERATLAFVVADTSGSAPEFSPVGERARRIVSVDGRLWRELMPLPAFGELVGRRWDDELAAAGGDAEGYDPEHPVRTEWERCKHDNPFALLGRSPYRGSKTRAQVEAAADRPVREWRDDNGRAHVTQIGERLSDLICIGGSVYEACREPTWVVDIGEGPDGATEAVVRLCLAPEPKGKDAPVPAEARITHAVVDDGFLATRFAADRMQDAVAHASHLAEEEGQAIARVRVGSAARVLLASAVTYPDDCVALETAAAALFVACARHLSSAPREAVRSWRDLREACLRTCQVEDGIPMPKASGALAAALSEVVASWTGFDPTGILYGRGTGVLGDATNAFERHGEAFRRTDHGHRTVEFLDAMREASRALVRWDVRPGNGREWAANAADAWAIDPENPEIIGGAPVNVSEVVTVADAAVLGAIVDLDLSDEAVRAETGAIRILAATSGRRVLAVATFDSATGEMDRQLLAASGREEAADRALRSFAKRGATNAAAPRPF
jgi:hypothetical protein